MLLAATGFTLGVVLFQQLPWLPDSRWLLLFLPFLWMGLHRPAAILGLAAIAGFSWSFAHAMWHQPDEIAVGMQGDTMFAEGTVLGLPEASARRTRFFFLANRLEQGGRQVYGSWKLRLNWYRDIPELLPGQRWRLPLRLKEAHGYRNAGGFDYPGWLYARGVRYTGYVKTPGARKIAEAGVSVHAWRYGLAEFIDHAGVSREAAGILKALVVGERSGLSRESKRLFSLTGTSHLIAISGLHIGLVAGLVYLFSRWLWSRFPRLCCRWPATVAAVFPSLLSALGYAALAGFSIPTQRALIMLALVYLAILSRRQVSGPHLLGVTLIMVLLLDPLAVNLAGFWLSFSAVAAIFWIVKTHHRFPWLSLQFGIALILMPVLVGLELPVSLVGPVVNMAAIPLFAMLVVPGALAGVLLGMMVPQGGQWVLQLIGRVLDRFMAALQWVVSGTPHVPLASMDIKVLYVLVASSVMLSVLLWRKSPTARVWCLLPGMAVLIMLLQRSPVPAPGSFRFTLLDVGQGLSAVIRTARHVLVFDTGPAFPSGFNTGDAVLLPWLRHQGIGRIDLLMLSHSDTDHVGGAASLLRSIPVSEVITGEPLSLKGVHPARCRAGRLWWWEGVRFEVLYPPAIPGLEGNNASCVLKISSRGQGVLLTGDIEKNAEHWLVEHAKNRLHSDLVVAAHHGSSSSSTQAFVDAVGARQVLYSAGKNNRWGFPRPEVVARWRNSGAREANTAKQGSLESLLGARKGKSVLALPTQRRSYWER
ncbi:DNA internalization-related competence protein ComEC/Rec2 [Thiolapillus brandeum]|uniref:Competence protein ComEC n=1 Tax=Thiolapillus brandeum TaxID=1076588 RepID=A0A7U6GIV7_9GAMM|nr:DNA internalization-related competence protein ComEC/Rec2 [Thiolapillus brandeum]BAO44491.1 competence protein ComEC [Thiolapillus brandeum]